jgi:hypothetical protein
MSAVRGDIFGALATAAGLTVQSVFRVKEARGENELKFMQDSWELDDKAKLVFDGIKNSVFSYRNKVALDYNQGDRFDLLTEDKLKTFFKWKKKYENDKSTKTLDSLVDLQDEYKSYPPYWALLAAAYFEKEEYQKCLDAIGQYEQVQSPIFIKDHEYAALLPKGIVALQKVYQDNNQAYILRAREYLEKIRDNTDDREWMIRYFAAVSYIDLAGLTGNPGDKKQYLENAEFFLRRNLAHLSDENEEQLKKYNEPLDTEISANTPESQRKRDAKQLKQLEKDRKTELPPFNGALYMNYIALSNLLKDQGKNMNSYNGYVADSLFVNPLAQYKYTGVPDSFEDGAFLLKDDSKGSAWRTALRWGVSAFFISGIRSIMGYPMETIDIILIVVGGILSLISIIAGFTSDAGEGAAGALGALAFILVLGVVGFFMGNNTYIIDLPVNVLASNAVIGAEITDITTDKEVYKREDLKWKNYEKTVPRDKSGNLTPDAHIQLSFKLSKFPKIEKDHDYRLKIPVDIGQFNVALIYTVQPGKQFVFQGVE